MVMGLEIFTGQERPARDSPFMPAHGRTPPSKAPEAIT